MRIDEFISEKSNSPDGNLLTALELIRHRFKDKKLSPKIKTSSLINIIRNTDKSFDYDALVSIHETNPALQNIIKSFNKEEVILTPFGDEKDVDQPDDQVVSPDASQQTTNTVSNMARKAAKKRDAELF